jgi:BolA protein
MMNVKTFITDTLNAALEPDYLMVEDESHQHNVPEGAQSHFKVTIVSAAFEGKRLIQRQRMVNGLLSEALQGPVHALAQHTFTLEEWQKRQGNVAASPNCMGGEK